MFAGDRTPRASAPPGGARAVRLHHRGGLGDAHVDEVTGAGSGSRGNRFGGRSEVDVDELLRFGRRWMRYAQELEERIARGDGVDERRMVEWIGDDDLAARGRFLFGARPDERSYPMPARAQRLDDPPSDVSRAAGDENRFSHVQSTFVPVAWIRPRSHSRSAGLQACRCLADLKVRTTSNQVLGNSGLGDVAAARADAVVGAV